MEFEAILADELYREYTPMCTVDDAESDLVERRWHGELIQSRDDSVTATTAIYGGRKPETHDHEQPG